MTFLRAHGDEQKQIRVQQIIDATAKLYDQVGYDKVTFSKISKSVNFSRINLYNYFACKEDIFLLLLLQEIEAMVQDAIQTMDKVYEDKEEFIDLWTELLLRHQRMLELFGIVNTVILRDASSENHKSYRIRMNKLYNELAKLFIRTLPFVSEVNVWSFIEFENSHALIVYPASTEYKVKNRIEIFPDAGYGTYGFASQYKPFLRTIINGLNQ